MDEHKESSFALTRQNVRKQLARLPAAIEDAKKASDARAEGYLEGQQSILQSLLSELMKHAEEDPPGLSAAQADVEHVIAAAETAKGFRTSWETGELSDEQFIAEVAHLLAALHNEESPD